MGSNFNIVRLPISETMDPRLLKNKHQCLDSITGVKCLQSKSDFMDIIKRRSNAKSLEPIHNY